MTGTENERKLFEKESLESKIKPRLLAERVGVIRLIYLNIVGQLNNI